MVRMGHNEFNLCRMSCKLSLVVTNSPERVNFQGSNLTGNNFFQTVNVPVQKNFGLLFVCLFCRLRWHISESFILAVNNFLRSCFWHFKNPTESKMAFHIGFNLSVQFVKILLFFFHYFRLFYQRNKFVPCKY